MSLDIDVKVTGPLLTGQAPAIVAQLSDEATEEIGRAAYAEVATNLDRSIRNPTPYYETQITLDTVGHDRKIHDRGVIYGSWLEGTSSRNQSTRFKGYASFRRAWQKIQRDAPLIADAAIRRGLARLG